MPDERYIALPDGRYVHIPGDATPQQLSALRERLSGMRGKSGPSGLETFGREASLGAFQGFGIAETEHPVRDTFKALGATPDLKDPGTYLGPAYGIGKGLATSGAEFFEGLGADAQHPEKFGPLDLAKIGHGLGSLSTQILALKGGGKAADTPLAESEVVRGVKAIPDLPPKIVQGATAAKYSVNKAEKAATAAAEKEMSAYKEATENVQKRHEQRVSAREKIEKNNQVIELAKKTLNQTAQEGTKKVTENLQKTLETAKTAFDSEYGDFDAKVLGKDAQNPKGKAESDLTAFANAVDKAKKGDIQGSEESIKQFTQIMDRLGKDKMDTSSGLAVPPGKTIPTVDLRGFVTELESIAYNKNLLPDVKAAIKNVAEAGKREVLKTVSKEGGQSAVNALKDLNSRYSDYLTDWRDTSSTNPLPRVRNILLEGVTKNNPAYPVHLDVARILKGDNATKALSLLQKYKKFGASPELLNGYKYSLERLASLPKPKALPEIKTPTFPKQPQVEPFNRQAAMRNALEERLNVGGRIGQLLKLLSIPADIVHGKFETAGSAAEQMLLIEAARRLLTSGKALDYLSKEKP